MERPLGLVAALLLAVLSIAAAARADEVVPPLLQEQLSKAERILLAAPQEDVEVGPGKGFLVEIEAALRGSGNQGSRARILHSAEGKKTRYASGQKYVFLLVKGPGGRGWSSLGNDVLAVEKDRVTWLAAGEKQAEFPLLSLEELIERSLGTAASEIPRRESLPGRWLVCWSERGTDTVAWLVEFEPDASGKMAVKLIEGALESTLLRDSEVSNETVNLDFTANGMDFVFRGRLNDGRVRGAVIAGEQTAIPAWLVPTELRSLPKSKEPRPSTGHAEYLDALSAAAPLSGLQRLIRRFKDEPIVFDAYLAELSFAAAENVPDAQFREIAEGYITAAETWGPQLKLKAEVDVALALARAGKYSEMGLEYAQRAERSFTPESPPLWGKVVRRITGQLLIGAGRDEEGLEHLRKVRAESAFDPEITWILAQQALKHERQEEALEMMGELVVLPGLEAAILSVVGREYISRGEKPPAQIVPSRLVEKIWKVLKRPEGELIAYLDELYERKVAVLAESRRPPRGAGEGNRVVLCELFTGAQCPPCVAADVATTALESRYSRTEVIVLRYHQHIPGPDPLANPETQRRFDLYHGEGTPSLFINGRPLVGIGGLLPVAQDLYGRICAEIDPYLTEQIGISIELAAKARGDAVELRAEAGGLPSFPEAVRLRLALAEEKVAMPARNGIRMHHMIVRTLPGGPDGIAPRDGKLSFDGLAEIGKLRERIEAYLEDVEKESEEKFDRKPIDLRKLVLVGWLQNEETGEIIQSASVPVDGLVELDERAGRPRASPPANKPGGKKK
ncbi:MAG: hypothetical protein EHM42_04025 [Planctomycetaceae bacterium]|nr:MAG: hypothetical protein EHM42_04025 [Planctomycetaceae bacterium]